MYCSKTKNIAISKRTVLSFMCFPCEITAQCMLWNVVSNSVKMVDMQPPPFRTLDDFLLCSARFSVPDVRNLERWNNRIINNLLYYQSNYFASAVAFLVIVGWVNIIDVFLHFNPIHCWVCPALTNTCNQLWFALSKQNKWLPNVIMSLKLKLS